MMRRYLVVWFVLCFVCMASFPSFAVRFFRQGGIEMGNFVFTRGMQVRNFTSTTHDQGFLKKHPFARATIDNAFKNMLVSDQDKEPLLSFLRAFTGINVKSAEYTPTSLPVLKTGSDDKQTYLDVSCVDDRGHHFIAEVQVQEQDFWNPRALYYAAGRFSQQLGRGGLWHELKPVVAINILDHDRKTLPDGRFRRDFQVRDVANPKSSRWGDMDDPSQIPYLRIIQYELPRVNLEKIENRVLRQWLELLKDSEMMETIPDDADIPIKKAYQRLDRRVWGPELQSDYTKTLLHLDDYKNVISRNRLEATVEIAMNLIKSGVGTDIIQSSTGLTTKQIEELRQGKLPVNNPDS